MKGRKNTALPIKIILLVTGIIATGIGILGIFLPLLPTTPFLILAAACFIRSSDRLYTWLITNRIFGEYLKNYLDRKGIPLGVKIITIFLLWITILLSALLFTDLIWVRILLVIIAVGVTIHLLYIKTYRP
jgi:hypothetical protein